MGQSGQPSRSTERADALSKESDGDADDELGYLVYSPEPDPHTACPARLFLIDASARPVKGFASGVQGACNVFESARWGRDRSVLSLEGVHFEFAHGVLVAPKGGAALWKAIEPPRPIRARRASASCRSANTADRSCSTTNRCRRRSAATSAWTSSTCSAWAPSDVVLLQDNGGSGCPAQFMFLTLDGHGSRTDVFRDGVVSENGKALR